MTTMKAIFILRFLYNDKLQKKDYIEFQKNCENDETRE